MNERNQAEAILGAAEELAEVLAPFKAGGKYEYGTRTEREQIASALTRALQSIGVTEAWAGVSPPWTIVGAGPIAPEIMSTTSSQRSGQRAIAAALWQFVKGELRHWQEQDDGSIDALTRRYRHLLESIAEWVAEEDKVDMWAPQSVEVRTEPECHHPAPMPEPMNLYCGGTYSRSQSKVYVLAPDLLSACGALQEKLEGADDGIEDINIQLLAKDVTVAK